MELKVDAIELDVHICKSGELVVIHDFTIDRTTNGSGIVGDLTLSELRKYKIANKYEIPTLLEVLDLIDQKCMVNIELKGKHTALKVSDTIESYVHQKNWTYEKFLVTSFEKDELFMMYQINPKIILGVLTETSVLQAIEWASAFFAKVVLPHFSLLTFENVLEIQNLGFEVFTWTVNDFDTIKKMKTYGVQGIISDCPDRI